MEHLRQDFTFWGYALFGIVIILTWFQTKYVQWNEHLLSFLSRCALQNCFCDSSMVLEGGKIQVLMGEKKNTESVCSCFSFSRWQVNRGPNLTHELFFLFQTVWWWNLVPPLLTLCQRGCLLFAGRNPRQPCEYNVYSIGFLSGWSTGNCFTWRASVWTNNATCG